jgi:CheY-like chemotaxis protein
MSISKRNPYKASEFNRYVLWKSIPSILRGASSEYLEKIGLDSQAIFEFSNITTQAEFAKKYKVDMGTLSDWNKRISEERLLVSYDLDNLGKMVRNVVTSLAVKQLKDVTPAGTKVLVDMLTKDTEQRTNPRMVNKRQALELIRKEFKGRDIPVLIMLDDSKEEREQVEGRIHKFEDRIIQKLFPEDEKALEDTVKKEPTTLERLEKLIEKRED